MRILIVDDEKLARTRMRILLQDCADAGALKISEIGDAQDALSAMQELQRNAYDVVLLDIHMPGANGIKLARELKTVQEETAVVFVTAHAEHAVQAFDVEAVDYLTKPVGEERMIRALYKAQQFVHAKRQARSDQAQLSIHHHGEWIKVPVSEVIYFKAVDKYITVRTLQHEYLMETSLNELHKQYGDPFVRVHRNALVAKRCMAAIESSDSGKAVRLHGVDERLAISRRQLADVRACFKN